MCKSEMAIDKIFMCLEVLNEQNVFTVRAIKLWNSKTALFNIRMNMNNSNCALYTIS